MAKELSSNWKKLQAQIKAESTASAPKRKSVKGEKQPATKRQRTSEKLSKHAVPAPGKKPQGVSKAGKQQMGTTQSSIVSRGSSKTVTPSLALWAEDNDISAEALAEAYGLGAKNNSLLKDNKTITNQGLAPNIDSLGKYVALDCEMVGTGPEGYDSILARVSLVDFHGRQIYDSFVRPKKGEEVTDWRTSITGITKKTMASARDFDKVQSQIAELIDGRILVGHDLRHDLAVLELPHPPTAIRDTSKLTGFRKYGHGPKPALRVLAREILGVEIHGEYHSSVEDARVTMLLFRQRKSEFDMEHANRYEKPVPAASKGPGKKGKKKKK